MGNGPNKAAGPRVDCLIYGSKGRYDISQVVDVEKRGPHGAVFRPVLRVGSGAAGDAGADGGLELAYGWYPAAPGAYFAEGAQLRHRNTIPEALRELLLRCVHAYDGREEMLFAAGVEASLGPEVFKPPTLLAVTSLGAVLVVRTATKAGFGAADLNCYFHVLHLQAVHCAGPATGTLTFRRPATAERPAKDDPRPSEGTLHVRMPKEALAQLLSALHLALAVVGGIGSAPQFTAVPEVAQAVWEACYWAPPQAPPDGGFACAFAASCVAEGQTVRRGASLQTLGKRYFESAALLRLDLTDIGPLDAKVVPRAVAHAWSGNRSFRAFTLKRQLAADELQCYAEAIRSAPLLEVDFEGAQLTLAQVEAFSEAMRSNPYGSLVAFNLSGTVLFGEPGRTLAAALDAALPPPPGHSFRAARLAGCFLKASDGGSADLLNLLGRRCSQLEVLDLSQNDLRGAAEGENPALATLRQVWLSPALREARFAGTGLPLAMMLPAAGSAPLGKRAALELDLSGCSVSADSLEQFAGLLGDVKDVTVTVRGAEVVPGSQAGPVAAVLSMLGQGPPRRRVRIDALDVPGGPEVALRPAGCKLQPHTSLTLGFSDAAARSQDPATSVFGAERALRELLGGAPRAVALRNAVVCEPQRLATALAAVSPAMATSHDPKELDVHGVGVLLALGITIATPKRSVGKDMGMSLTPLASDGMVSAARALKELLEASTGLESLAITGSATSAATGAVTGGQMVVQPFRQPLRVCGEPGPAGNMVALPPSANGALGAGPALAIGLQGLAANRTLLELDVSYNYMGDILAVTLGWALRQNRTLRSLSMDGNYITVRGWASFRGCLHGNKRLSKFVFPQGDFDWYTEHLGKVISGCNQSVVSAKANIKRAYKSTKGRRTARVLQVQNEQVEIIKVAKTQLGSAQRAHSKLVELSRAIMADVERNRQLAASAETGQKATRPLWAEARTVLRRMAKLQEKRASTLEAEKAAMWQRRNDLWKMWCEKVCKLAGKEKDEEKRKEVSSWFNTFRKEKLQMATREDGSVNQQELSTLSPPEAEHLMSLVPAELGDSFKTEFTKTRGASAKEREMEAKLEGLLVALESEKLALQELARDPAWAIPSESSGFSDLVEGLRHFGLDKELVLPSSPPPSLLQPQALAPAAPAAAPEAAAAAPPVVMGQPVAAAAPPAAQAALPVASPFSAPPQPVVQGVPVQGAAQAALHYDMYQLHNQRAEQYQRQQTAGTGAPAARAVGLAMLWQQAAERRRRRREQEEERRRQQGTRNVWAGTGGYSSGYSSGYNRGYDRGFNSGYCGGYDPFWGYPGGFGPYGWGSPFGGFGDPFWDPFGDIHQPPTDWNPIDPIPSDPLIPPFPADGGGGDAGPGGDSGGGGDDGHQGDDPGDHSGDRDAGDHGGDPDHPGDSPDAGDGPDAGDQGGDPGDQGVDDPGADGDAGDAGDPVDLMAMGYGAGGEEPPLPDGGGDDPAPTSALRAPPVRFRMPRRQWQPLVAEPPLPQIADHASLVRAELRAMGSWFGTLHEDLPYVRERDVLGTRGAALEAAGAAEGERVCLLTQCSVDRLGRLRDQCLAWAPGHCSAAIFLGLGECREEAIAALADIDAACAELGGRLVASLVQALPPASGAAAAYDRLYPANALRNVAMGEATSDAVLVLDVDFVPSQGLHATLASWPGGLAPLLAPAAKPACALVVPALEVRVEESSAPGGADGPSTAGCSLPRDFAELNACGDRVSAFHAGHFPKGHGATDFPRWARLASAGAEESSELSYEIDYEEYFEPYVVLSRRHAPRFDERFRGYGLNKCSFLRHWHALGHRFEVLVRGGHFVAAAPHPRSEAWRRNYGQEANPQEALKLALLWRLFLRELPGAAPQRGPAAAAAEAASRALPPPCPAPLPAALCRAAAAAVAAARLRGLLCGIGAGPLGLPWQPVVAA